MSNLNIQYYGVPDANPGYYNVKNAFGVVCLALAIFEELAVPAMLQKLNCQNPSPAERLLVSFMAKKQTKLTVNFSFMAGESIEPALGSPRTDLIMEKGWRECSVGNWQAHKEFNFDEHIRPDGRLDLMTAVHDTDNNINLEMELIEDFSAIDTSKEAAALAVYREVRSKVPTAMNDETLVTLVIAWWQKAEQASDIYQQGQRWYTNKVMNGLIGY